MRLLPRLHNAVLENDERTGYIRRYVDNPLTYLDRDAKRLYVGNESITDPTIRTRYIHNTCYPTTSGETARAYVDQCMQGHKLRVNRIDLSLLDIPPPLYYRGRGENPAGPWALVDLTAAYFELYRYLTLDLRYEPNGCLLLGHVPFLEADEWGEDKKARNALYGVVRARQFTEVYNGHLRIRRIVNKRLAPGMVGLMMHTLHAVMLDIRREYEYPLVMTDAVAVRPMHATGVIELLAKRWRLPATIKAKGKGYIWSLGDYKIGNVATKRVKRLDIPERGQPVDKLATDIDIERLRAYREWTIDHNASR